MTRSLLSGLKFKRYSSNIEVYGSTKQYIFQEKSLAAKSLISYLTNPLASGRLLTRQLTVTFIFSAC